MKEHIMIASSSTSSSSQTPPEIQRYYARALADERETYDFSFRRQHEPLVTNFIRNGDVEGLNVFLHSNPFSLTVGHMSSDPLRQARYTLVAGITLYSRAAIEGGLPEMEALVLSDAYIQTADHLDTPQAIHQLILTMIGDYTARVQARQHRHGHPAVAKCRDYISAHLHQPITMAELHAFCGYSESYITACFKHETGLSASQYILRERLRAAAQMLEQFDVSIQTVASTFAFPSASRFATAFRRQYGCTPRMYRKSHPIT